MCYLALNNPNAQPCETRDEAAEKRFRAYASLLRSIVQARERGLSELSDGSDGVDFGVSVAAGGRPMETLLDDNGHANQREYEDVFEAEDDDVYGDGAAALVSREAAVNTVEKSQAQPVSLDLRDWLSGYGEMAPRLYVDENVKGANSDGGVDGSGTEIFVRLSTEGKCSFASAAAVLFDEALRTGSGGSAETGRCVDCGAGLPPRASFSTGVVIAEEGKRRDQNNNYQKAGLGIKTERGSRWLNLEILEELGPRGAMFVGKVFPLPGLGRGEGRSSHSSTSQHKRSFARGLLWVASRVRAAVELASEIVRAEGQSQGSATFTAVALLRRAEAAAAAAASIGAEQAASVPKGTEEQKVLELAAERLARQHARAAVNAAAILSKQSSGTTKQGYCRCEGCSVLGRFANAAATFMELRRRALDRRWEKVLQEREETGGRKVGPSLPAATESVGGGDAAHDEAAMAEAEAAMDGPRHAIAVINLAIAIEAAATGGCVSSAAETGNMAAAIRFAPFCEEAAAILCNEEGDGPRATKKEKRKIQRSVRRALAALGTRGKA